MEKTENALSTVLSYVVTVAFAAAAAVVVAYVVWFRRAPISHDPESWGHFGDYVGGLLNPIFGVFSLTILVFSLQVQRKTLTEAQKQGVLSELQRLMATTSGDLDRALHSPADPRGPLKDMVLTIRSGFNRDRDVSIAEVLREGWRTMLQPNLSYGMFFGLAEYDTDAVFRALLRLDDCLREFRARGGDPVIGRLYGAGYGDAARVLAVLSKMKLTPRLEAAYSMEALERLQVPLDYPVVLDIEDRWNRLRTQYKRDNPETDQGS